MQFTHLTLQATRSLTPSTHTRRARLGMLGALVLLLVGAAVAARPAVAADPTIPVAPAPVCCGYALPDLLITGVGSCPGGVCVVVKNQSQSRFARAGTFSVVFSPERGTLQAVTVAGLAPGASTTVRCTNRPGCAAGGGRDGTVMADARNQVREHNERNNTAAWSEEC
jgi:hypothetical protein